jgi:1,4-dihydroxy-2-naphthoyl-CoA hydrolase
MAHQIYFFSLQFLDTFESKAPKINFFKIKKVINPDITVADLNKTSASTMNEHLGIEFLEIGDDYITAKMPVDKRTIQPYGLLHGGASLVLAETLGSIGADSSIDGRKYFTVGLEINANHIRSAKSGFVYGKAMPLHIGRRSHVWEVKIKNEDDQLVCVSRITLAIIEKK